MFGTLRYVTQNNNPSYVTKRPGDRPSGRRGSNNPHFACERCRQKKLRCSGQKEGCNRCRGLGSVCSYPDASNGSSSKQQQREKQQARPDDGGRQSVTSTPPTMNQEGARSPSRVNSTESVSGVTGHNHSLSTSGHIVDAHHESSDYQPSSSMEKNGSVNLLDWTNQLDTSEAFNSFSPDQEMQSFDGDLLMSDFFLSECFDITTPMAEDKLNDDSYANSSSYRANSGYKSLLPPQNSPRDRSCNSCTPLLSPENRTRPKDCSRPNPDYQHNLLETGLGASQTQSFHQMPKAPRDDGSNFSRENLTPETCQCLQMTVSMLEEIETKTSSIGLFSVDVMMNFHQNILLECTSILTCRSCTDRPERMTLITMVAEKLASLCEKTSSACLEAVPQAEIKHSNNLKAISGAQGMAMNSRNQSERTNLSHTRNTSSPIETLFCGEYRVGKPKDWAYLMRVVICFQLKALIGFLQRMKLIAAVIARRENLLPKVGACEEKVYRIVEGLWKSP